MQFSGAAAKMRQYANTIHSEAYAVVDERLAARKAGTQKRNLLVDDDAKVDRDLLDLFMVSGRNADIRTRTALTILE